jgi:hypothetical protein
VHGLAFWRENVHFVEFYGSAMAEEGYGVILLVLFLQGHIAFKGI